MSLLRRRGIAATTRPAAAVGVQIVGSTSTFITVGGSASAVPAGTQDGDLMAVFFAYRGSDYVPPGFTSRAYATSGSVNSANAQGLIVTRIADDEPESYVFEPGAAYSVVFVTFRGAVYDDADAVGNETGTFDTPSVAGTSGGLLIPAWTGRNVDFASTAVPSGVTEEERAADGNISGGSILVGSEPLTATESTGIRTATITSAHGRAVNMALTVKPA